MGSGRSGLTHGCIHVYTGNGKGKSTAALGLAIRGVGKGLKVYMIQFMKGDIEYGEVVSARRIPNFQLVQFGRPDFVDKTDPDPRDIDLARQGLEHAREIIDSGDWDIVILDELNVALDWHLVQVEDVLDLIDRKPSHVELVLTGRYARPEVIDKADYVTEMHELKHPYNRGILAREGIEH